MAGIKRKSTVPAQVDSKSNSKKVKVDKPAAKRSSKREETKPTKASKKSKPTDDLIESDTTEEENGFYGFSAGAEEDEPVKNKKEKKEKKEQKGTITDAGKSSSTSSTLTSLNGMHKQSLRPFSAVVLTWHSFIFPRGACKAEGAGKRAKSRQTERRCYRTIEAAVGEAETKDQCDQRGAKELG